MKINPSATVTKPTEAPKLRPLSLITEPQNLPELPESKRKKAETENPQEPSEEEDSVSSTAEMLIEQPSANLQFAKKNSKVLAKKRHSIRTLEEHLQCERERVK